MDVNALMRVIYINLIGHKQEIEIRTAGKAAINQTPRIDSTRKPLIIWGPAGPDETARSLLLNY